ncbi:oligosaccharide flippase family protein [Vibrio splendidus]
MLAKDTVLYAVANGLNRGAILLISPILLIFLTIEEYGHFTLVVAVSQFLIPLFCLSGTAGIVREGTNNSAVALYLTYKFALIVLANLVLLSVVYWLFNSKIPYWVLLSIILGAINTLFELVMALYRALHQKIHYFYVSVIKALSVVLSVIVGMLASSSVFELFYIMIFFESIAVIGLAYYLYCSRKVTGFESFSLSKVFGYSLFIIPHGIAVWAMSSSDRLLINYFLTKKELGIYSLAYTIATIQALINSGLGSALPQIIYRDIDKWKNVHLRVKVIKLFSAASAGLMVLIYLFIFLDERILNLLNYHDQLRELLGLLLPALYLMGLYQYYSIFLFYERKTKNVFYLSSVISVFNVLINFFFIEVYGIKFSAFATLVTYLFFFMATFTYVKYSIPKLNLSVFREFGLSILMLSLLLLVNLK